MKYDDSQIRMIAEVCHEANRAYCQSIGDTTQKPWPEAPEWQKKSATAGVMAHFQNPNMKPEDSHNEWMKKKLEDGWTHGVTKDEEKKTHPCLVPFHELPAAQQIKDHIFTSICKAAVVLTEREAAE